MLINEPGTYRLIFHAQTEEAKQFQRWVFHEVLPEIRRHGRYELDKAMPLPAALWRAFEQM
jgi:anti-repressor protein